MKQNRISAMRTTAGTRFALAALAGFLAASAPSPAEEKTPAARLGRPIIRTAGSEPAVLPIETEIREPVPTPAEIAPAGEALPTVPPVSPIPIAKAGELLLKPGMGREPLKAAPLDPTPSVRASGAPPGLGMAQTRWTIYEERVAGGPPIQMIARDPSARTAPRSEVVVATAPSDRVTTGPELRLPEIGTEAKMEVPATPLPAAKAPSAPTGFLPGTLVSTQGGTVPISKSIQPPRADTLLPDVSLQSILVARPPVIPAAVFPTPKPVPQPETVARAAVVPLPGDTPTLPVPTFAIKAQPGEWTAAPANPKNAPEMKTPARNIYAPVPEPFVLGSATATPASGSRSQALMQGNSVGSRWEGVEPSPAVQAAPAVAKVVAPAAPPKLAAAPAGESKVVPASATVAKPQPVSVEAALPPTYTLMPWQWVEKIRSVAGPSATNLVALVSTRGEVKVKFDCPGPTEARAIADRVSAIPEFRKLTIDFEINAN